MDALLKGCCEKSISQSVDDKIFYRQRVMNDRIYITAAESLLKDLEIAVLDGKYHQVVNCVPDRVK